MAISEAHLSEPNNSSDGATQSDIERRRKSIQKVQIAFETYKIEKYAFEDDLKNLSNELNK